MSKLQNQDLIKKPEKITSNIQKSSIKLTQNSLLGKLLLPIEEEQRKGYQFKLTDFWFTKPTPFSNKRESHTDKLEEEGQAQPQKDKTEGENFSDSPIPSPSSTLPKRLTNANNSSFTDGLGLHIQEIINPVSTEVPIQEPPQVQQGTEIPSTSALPTPQIDKQKSKTKQTTSKSNKGGKSSQHSSSSSQKKGKSSHKTGKSSHKSKKDKDKSKRSSPKTFSFPLIVSQSMRDDLFNQYLKNSVGFSQPALTAALGSVRPATSKIYNLHFSKFCIYLKDKQHLKDLREVKIKHLADYFLFLDAELQLSYAKIVSIRTALRIPLQLVHGIDLLISQELKLVLKGIKGGKTPIRTTPVVWNLPKVLDYLKSKPFYHLNTLSEENL